MNSRCPHASDLLRILTAQILQGLLALHVLYPYPVYMNTLIPQDLIICWNSAEIVAQVGNIKSYSYHRYPLELDLVEINWVPYH